MILSYTEETKQLLKNTFKIKYIEKLSNYSVQERNPLLQKKVCLGYLG